jgi:alpha-beta hydrolase superfamily lysophospholipase
MTTRLAFKDDLLDAQLVRAAGAAGAGGAQLGECLATASRIHGTDLDQWYTEWNHTGDTAFALGVQANTDHDRVGARDAFFRASTYYRTAGGMLLGIPLDPRLVDSNTRQTEAFRRGAALLDVPPEILEIPLENTTLPGYFFRAGRSAEPRATVILTGGYDGTVEELYFFTGAAALERGYNVLAFDGPGQGGALLQRGLSLRPDWENVISVVVDYALTRADVAPDQLALIGLSLGGYLAPRAASGEHRLAACIADCGAFDIFESFLARLPDALATRVRNGNSAAEALLRPLLTTMMHSPTGGWALRRMQLVHGITDPIDLINATRDYSLAGRAENIICPTFVCNAEGDDISASAPELFAALTCDKEFVTFTAAEGAGDHCEGAARSIYHARSFGWLDRVLSQRSSSSLPTQTPRVDA